MKSKKKYSKRKQNKRTITTIANNSTVSYNRFSRAATDLLISEYCDFATSGYTGARFIEIYNPTDTDIDLGTASLQATSTVATGTPTYTFTINR